MQFVIKCIFNHFHSNLLQSLDIYFLNIMSIKFMCKVLGEVMKDMG